MDNLNGMHHQGGGAAAGAVGGGCHAPPTSTPGSNLQDHAAVTVTVGGPMLHRNSYVGSAITISSEGTRVSDASWKHTFSNFLGPESSETYLKSWIWG